MHSYYAHFESFCIQIQLENRIILSSGSFRKWDHPGEIRDLDSVGAVGAAAPTDFEESSFCALDFHSRIPLATDFGAYLKICTHSFEILTRSLTSNDRKGGA